MLADFCQGFTHAVSSEAAANGKELSRKGMHLITGIHDSEIFRWHASRSASKRVSSANSGDVKRMLNSNSSAKITSICRSESQPGVVPRPPPFSLDFGGR